MSNSEYLDFIEEKFMKCFQEKGYIKEEPVNITSGIDPTIDFIGSKISTLKKYLLEDNIGNPGRYIIQNSMKLKALKSLKDTEPMKFGSYYKCMGILAEPNLEKVVSDTFDCLLSEKYFNISPEDLRIRINSEDTDLLDAIKNVNPKVIREIDTVDKSHYKHKYGLDDKEITGRDFNIGLRYLNTEKFINCGTFVLMETPEKKLAVDMGMGNCTFSMCKFGLDSTISSSRMGDIIKIDSIEKMKFADSLISVAVLLNEDIINNKSKHFRKKFRQFFNCLLYWNQKFNYTNEQLLEIINEFLKQEYKKENCISSETWQKVLK